MEVICSLPVVSRSEIRLRYLIPAFCFLLAALRRGNDLS
jgi:hypothetical protein